MSTCISRHGEYGSHVLDPAGSVEDRFVCSRCFVTAEDDLFEAFEKAEAERDAARAELERVRCSAQRIVADLIEAFEHIVMDTDEDRELHSRVIDTARNAAAALRPVPEQEQP